MTRQQLIEQIRLKKSFLCVGLDPDLKKLPAHILAQPDAVFEFNKAIIDATATYAVAYKPNIAFYEALGPKGWSSLQRTLSYIPKDCFTIADAKRGDIGNTSTKYAEVFFDKNAAGMSFDSITVAPYMGHDSVQPFLDFKNKWTILLALTSNSGSEDFQLLVTNPDISVPESSDDDFPANGEVIYDSKNKYLFEKTLEIAQKWASPEQLMFVIGATKAQWLERVRHIAPDNFLLIPGVGAQGGSLAEVCKYGMNNDCGLLVNAARSILYASSGTDFAQKAAEEAQNMQAEMEIYLREKGIV